MVSKPYLHANRLDSNPCFALKRGRDQNGNCYERRPNKLPRGKVFFKLLNIDTKYHFEQTHIRMDKAIEALTTLLDESKDEDGKPTQKD